MEPNARTEPEPNRPARKADAPSTLDLAAAGLDRVDRRLRDLEAQIAELRAELRDLSAHLERSV